jgi:hypothetical protein
VTTLSYWTLTGRLTSIVVDYTDIGVDPDENPITATVDIIPRIPAGQILWASGLTPEQGLILAPMRCRFDTDGYLRTIVASAHNETQTVATTLTSGTFPITWGGDTANIPWNATSLQFETAMEALPSIGAGNISVGGPNGGPWPVTFAGVFASSPQPLMTTTDPTHVTITETRVGTLNQGVKLVANTDAINIDQLVYDLRFSNVVYNKQDQIIWPRGFVAPNQGNITIDMADLEWVQPLPGIG